jgi:urease accessory protein UreH
LPPDSFLQFGSREGRTVVLAARGELPLILQRPIRGASGGAVLTLLSPAGALFGGDAVRLHVCCEPGTDVTLTTAAATKLNRGCIDVSMHVQVKRGATFRYMPHELIPFRDAHYAQRIDVDVDVGANVSLLEVIGPGASQTPFTYCSLAFATTVRISDQLAVRERFVLRPANVGQLGGYTHYGSLLHIGASPAPSTVAGIAGVSRLPCEGWVVKTLGESAQAVRASLLAVVPGSQRLLPLLPP